MCQPTRCRVCQKTTWAGCGQHIASVKRTVAASEWCNGKHTPAEIQAAQDARGGFFSRLFGRSTTTTRS